MSLNASNDVLLAANLTHKLILRQNMPTCAIMLVTSCLDFIDIMVGELRQVLAFDKLQASVRY